MPSFLYLVALKMGDDWGAIVDEQEKNLATKVSLIKMTFLIWILSFIAVKKKTVVSWRTVQQLSCV